MAEELKACPFCGGTVRFHSDEDCHGCHYIECSGCKAMFDFSPTTDPENQCDSLHELQCGIAHTWNTRAQLPGQGGEAVEVVARIIDTPTAVFPAVELTQSGVRISGTHDLMTVAQHQRILAARVADPSAVAVPNETALRRAARFLDGLDSGCNEVKTLRALLAKSEGVKP